MKRKYAAFILGLMLVAAGAYGCGNANTGAQTGTNTETKAEESEGGETAESEAAGAGESDTADSKTDSADADQKDETTVFGEITAVEDGSITIKAGMVMKGGSFEKPDGEMPEGEMPEKPENMPSGERPEKPENMPSGERPEKPEGMPDGAPEMPQGDDAEKTYTITGDTIWTDVIFEDLEPGDFVELTVDSDDSILEVKQSSVGAPDDKDVDAVSSATVDDEDEK